VPQTVIEAFNKLTQTRQIVFMTTNHLEKLDPALIRPGRVGRWTHCRNWPFRSWRSLLSCLLTLAEFQMSISKLALPVSIKCGICFRDSIQTSPRYGGSCFAIFRYRFFLSSSPRLPCNVSRSRCMMSPSALPKSRFSPPLFLRPRLDCIYLRIILCSSKTSRIKHSPTPSPSQMKW